MHFHLIQQTNQKIQKERSETRELASKQGKMLLKDMKAKYLSSNIQDWCLPTNVLEMNHAAAD